MIGTQNITVPAAVNGAPGVYVQRTADASIFVCLSTSGPFDIRSGNGVARTITGLTKIGQPGGPVFEHLTFLNGGSTEVNCVCYIGVQDAYSADVSTTVASGTVQTDSATQGAQVAHGWSKIYPGTIDGVARRYLEADVFENSNKSIDVFVSGLRIARVRGDTTRRFDLRNDITLNNSSGTPLSLSVYEVF